jgi:tetratricopeptide (TPR) repeat protein
VLCGGGLAVWRPWNKPPAPAADPVPAVQTPVPGKAAAHSQHPAMRTKAVPKAPVAAAQPDEADTGLETASMEPPPSQTPHPAIDANRQGLEFLNANQASAAVDAFSKAIAIRPEWAQPYLGRGRAYQKEGDFNAAIGDYGQVLRLQPTNAHVHALRGTAYLRLKDDERAIADFNAALTLKPDLPAALYGRGMVRMNRASVRLALEDFNAAIRGSPNYAVAYTARGNAKRRLGDSAGAEIDFQKARELGGR